MPGTAIDELIRLGNLTGAIQEATQQVRNHPADSKARTSLFELLCLTGEFDRAEKQLDVLEQQREKSDLGVQVYRNCVRAERQRHRLYTEGVEPHFLNEPPAYVDLLLEGIRHIKLGRNLEARRALDQAEEARPALSGKRDDKSFKDFRTRAGNTLGHGHSLAAWCRSEEARQSVWYSSARRFMSSHTGVLYAGFRRHAAGW